MEIFKKAKPAIFELWREEDHKQISGTGHVLDGVVFPDGTTVVRWRKRNKSTAVFESYRKFEKVHMAKHGACEIRWINGFNGVEFAYNYLYSVYGAITGVPSNSKNKYMLAKLKNVFTVKLNELGEIRNGKYICIPQARGANQTSLSRTGVSAESLSGESEDNEVSSETQGCSISETNI